MGARGRNPPDRFIGGFDPPPPARRSSLLTGQRFEALGAWGVLDFKPLRVTGRDTLSLARQLTDAQWSMRASDRSRKRAWGLRLSVGLQH